MRLTFQRSVVAALLSLALACIEGGALAQYSGYTGPVIPGGGTFLPAPNAGAAAPTQPPPAPPPPGLTNGAVGPGSTGSIGGETPGSGNSGTNFGGTSGGLGTEGSGAGPYGGGGMNGTTTGGSAGRPR
jgi:hypothetical protein